MRAYIPRGALVAALALGALGAGPFAPAARAQSSSERDREKEQERREREREREQDRRDREREREREEAGTSIDTTFAFASDGTVDLTLVDGTITVTGWTRGEARVRASTESGDIDRTLTRSRIELDVRPRHGGGDTRYEVSVPAGARVVAHTTSGDITVRAVSGEVEAHTTSGQLEVSDLGARAMLESVSGDVKATGVKGDVSIEVVSGGVEVRDVGGDVQASSVSGEIQLRNVRAKSAHAETVSGEIEFGGTLDPAGRYEFSAHSGDVRLVLPPDAGALVSLQTFSGTIDTDFPMTLQPTDRRDRDDPGKRMELTLGKGGARVRVETFSGNVTLEKGPSR